MGGYSDGGAMGGFTDFSGMSGGGFQQQQQQQPMNNMFQQQQQQPVNNVFQQDPFGGLGNTQQGGGQQQNSSGNPNDLIRF